jgi:RNA polymerase sigma factor (sigma-70 family)
MILNSSRVRPPARAESSASPVFEESGLPRDSEGGLVYDNVLVKTYLTHRAALVETAAPIVGCRFRAEDVVQDVYLRLTQSTAEAEIRQPASYLFRLVRNLAVDRARRLALERRYGANEPVRLSAPAADPSPEDALVARELLRGLEQALAELPDRTRLAFEMNRVGGYSVEHVSRTLGISTSLTYLLLRDAMTHCRDRLFAATGQI